MKSEYIHESSYQVHERASKLQLNIMISRLQLINNICLHMTMDVWEYKYMHHPSLPRLERKKGA